MLLMLVVILSCLEFLGDMQECCPRKLHFECTMQVKCLDAAVGEKVLYFRWSSSFAPSTDKADKQQEQTTSHQYHGVGWCQESWWHRAVLQALSRAALCSVLPSLLLGWRGRSMDLQSLPSASAHCSFGFWSNRWAHQSDTTTSLQGQAHSRGGNSVCVTPPTLGWSCGCAAPWLPGLCLGRVPRTQPQPAPAPVSPGRFLSPGASLWEGCKRHGHFSSLTLVSWRSVSF